MVASFTVGLVEQPRSSWEIGFSVRGGLKRGCGPCVHSGGCGCGGHRGEARRSGKMRDTRKVLEEWAGICRGRWGAQDVGILYLASFLAFLIPYTLGGL